MDRNLDHMKRVAAIQMASGPQVSANLLEAERLIALAAKQGAELVVLPENFAIMTSDEKALLAAREAPGVGPIQSFLAKQAAEHHVWIVGGTVPLHSDDSQRARSACYVYAADGSVQARYDKMHLFDVHLEEAGEEYNESRYIEPGNAPVVLDTPFGRMGVAICYDLRFPELFRKMAEQGMDLIVLPSAFTAVTGRAHWESLVRARAIENLSYVIAAGQGGFHLGGRATYGNSMVVDPWGTVLNRLQSGAGIVLAEMDSDLLARTRKRFPVLQHRRLTCSDR
jgi:predicted amidohydrolase